MTATALAVGLVSLHPSVSGVGAEIDLDEIVDDSIGGTEWLQAAAIMVGAIAVAIAANRIARAVLARWMGDGFGAIITGRIISYSIVLVGLFYALTTLGVRVGPLIGALGISGLVLALALQTVVENFVGALILQTRRPFTIGDTVDLDGHIGVVTDIDARTVAMRGLDGTTIRVPNTEVLGNAIVNLTGDSARRSEISVGVAYDTNLETATRVLHESVDRVPRIREQPAPQVLLRQFGSSSIDFTIYYWHSSDIPSELTATHDLVMAVHQGLADADITIAFPQTVVWSGHDAEPRPYGRTEPTEVFSGQPTEATAPEAEPGTVSEARSEPPRRRWWRFWQT